MNYRGSVRPATEPGKPVQVNVSFFAVAVAQVVSLLKLNSLYNLEM